MADTSNLGITKPTPGGDAGTWGATLNTGADNFDTAVAGTLSNSVAGSANVSLTDAEALNANHIYTGELTGNIAVHVPIKSRRYQVFNNTTGSFTLKVKTSSETNGTLVGQGETLVLMCDGTSVISGVTGAAATSVSDFTTNNLKVLTCASATNLVAATGSFTTKVSGVAAEFSGNVSAAEFYGGGGNLTGISSPTSVASFTVNELGVVTDLGVGTASSNPDTIFHVEGSSFISAKLETTGTSKQVDLTLDSPTGSATNAIYFNIGASTRSAIMYQESSDHFDFRHNGGGLSNSYMKFTDTEVVFNDGSADLDFRVETDGNDKMIYAKGNTNSVGIGCDPATTEILKAGTDSGADGTQYDILKFQGSGSGPIACVFKDDIGTSSTTIMTVNVAGVGGGMAFISGGTDPHTFTEMVVWANQGGVSVFGSCTKNSPPARTYSVSGNSLQLAYASGTHAAAVWAICMRSN